MPARPARQRARTYLNAAAAIAATIACIYSVACGDATPLDTLDPLGPCAPSAATANASLPIFGPPFTGERPVGNVFDHDLPLAFDDANTYQLSTCAQSLRSPILGHNGYDWLMPIGTPLLSVAEGRVVMAGREPSLNCPPLGHSAAGLVIVIRTLATPEDSIDAIYGHVDRVDVAVGDTVHIGDTIGASGNTGCSTGPHLHFSAARFLGPRGEVMIDPYGWNSSTHFDPWYADIRGAQSAWLWKDGAAPRLFR